MRQGGIRLIDGERRTVDLNEGEHADGERSCVVFTYAPGDEENRHRALPEPFFVASLCSSVEQAVRKLVPEFGILRFAILGHSKLQAGLTVQTTLDAVFEGGAMTEPFRHFITSHIAVPTAPTTSLDSILQLVGEELCGFEDDEGHGLVEYPLA